MADRTADRLSVLFVESDVDTLHFIKRSLETHSRFPAHVDHAADIPEALKKLKDRPYQLLLSGMELNDATGFDLFDEVRRAFIQMPFVLMAPVRDEQLIKDAMRRGIADMIVKNENHYQELALMLKKSFDRFYGAEEEILAETQDEANRRLAEAGVTPRDTLTGLCTHGHLYDRLVREFSGATRYNYPLTCLMIDIDHFGSLNDKFGYAAGESIIRQCADLLFENCRLSDYIARYGGQEFAVLFPHVNYEAAHELAVRLRKVFAETVFDAAGEKVRLTVSIGVSSYPQDAVRARGDLIIFSEQALGRAKAGGRNRVAFYRDIAPPRKDAFPELSMPEDKIQDFQRNMVKISNNARRAYFESSRALIATLEAKDRFTAGHSATCAMMAQQVAETMGMAPEDAETVQHAALLHDIGKICISDAILLKPARLTLAEYETIKQHAYHGYKILKPIRFLQQEAVLVLHHHEWFNGEGYPCRLKGEEIPLGARIICVVDSYDTIRSAGSRYKKTQALGDAVNELINCAGTQFDPFVVKAFISVLIARHELTEGSYDNAKLEEIIGLHKQS